MALVLSHDLFSIEDSVDQINQAKSAPQALEDRSWVTSSVFDQDKNKEQFRKYESACDRVKLFYSDQHKYQTYEFNVRVREEFKARRPVEMSIFEAIGLLDTLVDESDPDTELSQIQHLLQTAEVIRRDGKPEWMQVVGLVHDLGKLIHFFRPKGQEPRQWDVVGDTFVVGAAFDNKIIYPDTFEKNPDTKHPVYSTQNGIYNPGCGLENVLLSWGHDEYLYHVFKDQCTLPKEGLAMIRFHSFYPWHRDGAYRHFMNEEDESLLEAVLTFNPYDLYSKSDAPPDVEVLKPYYEGLVNKFFPPKVKF